MTGANDALAPEQGAGLTRRVTILSVCVAVALTLGKLVGWRSSGSVAMLASLADSVLDVVAACATFAAVRYAATPPDDDHRFGHGKAEGFSSLLQATLVFTSAALIGWEALLRLIHPAAVQMAAQALGIMGASTAATGALVLVQGEVLKRTRSVAVSGDRAHYLADVVSNIAALAGVAIAAGLNLPRVDAIAGLLVAGWLVYGAAKVLKESSASLLDRELDDEDRRAIEALVLQDGDIYAVSELRTRASGPVVHVQMHVDLDPDKTLAQVHEILIRAEERILVSFPTADILIHPDPRGRAEPHSGAFAERRREPRANLTQDG